MNELQIWFPGNDLHDNWIYFRTYATNLDDAIDDFRELVKGIGIDLADMKPVQYNLWDSNSNHISGKSVKGE